MKGFGAAIMPLIEWIRSNNIDPEKLALVVNIPDSDEAFKLDCALRSDQNAHMHMAYGEPLDCRDFRLNGLRILIESPLHLLPDETRRVD